MKTKIFYILISIATFFSCSKKQEYTLAGLSNPLLDKWIADFKEADDSFSIDNFKVQPPANAANFEKTWYDLSILNEFADGGSESDEPADDGSESDEFEVSTYVYSPNGNFYLDLDFYNIIENGVFIGCDANAKTTLVDVSNNKAIDILNTGIQEGIEDAFWVNDTVFVLLGRVLNDSGDRLPEISIWNRETELVHYQYDGKIKYPEVSFFEKRLIRHGIKTDDEN